MIKDGRVLLGKRRGSHGAGEYASPGGHLEHLEAFDKIERWDWYDLADLPSPLFATLPTALAARRGERSWWDA